MGNPQLKGSIFFFQRSRRKHHADRLEGDLLLEICCWRFAISPK